MLRLHVSQDSSSFQRGVLLNPGCLFVTMYIMHDVLNLSSISVDVPDLLSISIDVLDLSFP